MKSNSDLVYGVWDSYNKYISEKSNPIEKFEITDLITSFFCPADFYVYVIDFPTRKFDFVSPHVKKIFGINPEDYHLETLPEHIHPDDVQFVGNCEYMVADFIVAGKRSTPEASPLTQLM